MREQERRSPTKASVTPKRRGRPPKPKAKGKAAGARKAAPKAFPKAASATEPGAEPAAGEWLTEAELLERMKAAFALAERDRLPDYDFPGVRKLKQT